MRLSAIFLFSNSNISGHPVLHLAKSGNPTKLEIWSCLSLKPHLIVPEAPHTQTSEMEKFQSGPQEGDKAHKAPSRSFLQGAAHPTTRRSLGDARKGGREEMPELRLHPQLLLPGPQTLRPRRPRPRPPRTPHPRRARRPRPRPRRSARRPAPVSSPRASKPRPRRRRRTISFQPSEAEATATATPQPRGSGFLPRPSRRRAMELRATDGELPAHPRLPSRLAPELVRVGGVWRWGGEPSSRPAQAYLLVS